MKKRRVVYLQNRLFICFSILIVLFIIAISMPHIMYIENIILDRQLDQVQRMGEKTAEQIDTKINNMNTASLYVCASVSNIDVVNSRNALTYVSDLMMSLNVQNETSFIRISFYNKEGKYICTGRSSSKKKVNERFASNEFKELLSYMASTRDYYLVGPHKDPWSESGLTTVSVLRNITNLSTYQNVGVIEVEIKVSEFEKNMDSAVSEGISCALLSPGGELYYTTRNFQFKDLQTFKKAVNGYIDENGCAAKRAELCGKSVLISVSNISSCGWHIVFIDSEDVLLGPLNTMKKYIFIPTAIIIVCAVAVIYMLSMQMSRSIHALSCAVEGVTFDHSSFDPVGFSDSKEIMNLSDSFARMLDKLRISAAELVQGETRLIKAEMMVLQSQMDPHFLYNMFSVIDFYAYEHSVSEICDICRRMSTMLRYVTSYSEPLVSISAELDHAKDYLELMKFRYESDFMYTISVHKSCTAEGCMVPKHIIQPILENCFKHGFKQKEVPWRIDIAAEVDENAWSVEIRDNGTGFDEERRAGIFSQVDNILSSARESIYDLSIGGLGLVNTFARLKLKYGDTAVMDIKTDGGSVVTIGGKSNA